MAANVREFELAIDRFESEELPEASRRHQQDIAIEALESVVKLTPVDTGNARGGWEVSLGSPSASTSGSRDPIGAATVASGAARIRQAPAYSLIWIHNGVAYIGKLEDGRSQQAPRGMVARTLADLRSKYGL